MWLAGSAEGREEGDRLTAPGTPAPPHTWYSVSAHSLYSSDTSTSQSTRMARILALTSDCTVSRYFGFGRFCSCSGVGRRKTSVEGSLACVAACHTLVVPWLYPIVRQSMQSPREPNLVPAPYLRLPQVLEDGLRICAACLRIFLVQLVHVNPPPAPFLCQVRERREACQQGHPQGSIGEERGLVSRVSRRASSGLHWCVCGRTMSRVTERGIEVLLQLLLGKRPHQAALARLRDMLRCHGKPPDMQAQAASRIMICAPLMNRASCELIAALGGW